MLSFSWFAYYTLLFYRRIILQCD